MTRALRSVSSEKGRDPRDFAIIAYGGSGPVHAGGLADDLGVTTVLVPPVAGLFSAVGLLFARPEFHEVRSCHLDVDAVDPAGSRRAPRRDGGRARASRSRVARSRAGCAPPTSATAARAGRSRSSFRQAPSTARCSPACARASRTSTRCSTAFAASRARRSRSGPCGSRRSAPPRRTPSFDVADALVPDRHATRRMWLGGEARRRAGAVARVDRRGRRGGAAARRRVRHDGRRPGRLERPAPSRDRHARAREGGRACG